MSGVNFSFTDLESKHKSPCRGQLGEELVIVVLSLDMETNRKRVSERHGGLEKLTNTLMVS